MIIFWAGYALRIVLLLYAIVKIVRARRSFNGLARGLVALAVLLIVRTFDDVSHLLGVHLLDDTTTLLLSSLVVMIFFIDLQRIHSEHPLREASRRMRHMNEADLEKLICPPARFRSN